MPTLASTRDKHEHRPNRTLEQLQFLSKANELAAAKQTSESTKKHYLNSDGEPWEDDGPTKDDSGTLSELEEAPYVYSGSEESETESASDVEHAEVGSCSSSLALPPTLHTDCCYSSS